jgi:hypothetical protein
MAQVIIKGPTSPRPLPHGNNQQTPAVQSLIGTVYGGFGSPPRSKGSLGRRRSANRKAAKSRPRKKGVSHRKSAAASKGGPLVKGSVAAKRRMAALRKMRK